MRKYLQIFKLSWSEALQYRANIFLELLGTAILMFLTIRIWKTIFAAVEVNEIRGFSQTDMVFYLLLGMFFAMSVLNSSQGDDVNDEINDGSVSLLLVKPLAPPLYWFMRDMARRFIQIVAGCTVLVIFAIGTGRLVPYDLSVQSIGLIILFLCFASILHFLLFFTFSVIAFWLERTWGERFFLRVMIEIAGGLLIPLSLFPTVWQNIFNVLPFKFLIYIPIITIQGKLTGSELVMHMGYLLGWIVLFCVLSAVLWYRGVRQYDGAGH